MHVCEYVCVLMFFFLAIDGEGSAHQCFHLYCTFTMILTLFTVTLCFVQLRITSTASKRRWHSTVVFLNSKRIRGKLFDFNKCVHKAVHIYVILTLAPGVKTSVVAAAVIFSYLLRAGDVEMNPGPGRK